MKPILNKTLLLLVLAMTTATLSQADYDSTHILNETAVSDTNINVAYNRDDIINGGAVERSGDAGSNGSTLVEGNITISAGQNIAGATEPRPNHGVYIGAEFSNEDTPEATTNASITLKTAQAADQISIDVYSNGSAAVRNNSESSTISLDASRSESGAINLNLHEAAGSWGIVSYGKTEVTGNLKITSTGTTGNVIGINSSTRVDDRQTGLVTVAGNIDINFANTSEGTGISTSKAKFTVDGDVSIRAYRGILGLSGSTYQGRGMLTINSVYRGIHIETASTLAHEGDLEITASGANADAILVNTGSSINVQGSTKLKGYQGIFVGSTGSNATFAGEFHAETTSNCISAYENASVMLLSKANLTSSVNNGIISQKGASVTLTGASLISGKAASIRVNGGTVTGNAAEYILRGDIISGGDEVNNGLVDMNLTGHSLLTGKTTLSGYADINLSLSDTSLWNVTGNSTLTNLTLGQGSALQLAFNGASLTDIIAATGTITLEAGSIVYLTGDLSGLQGESFDFFSGTIDNLGVKFVGFDGSDWVEYEYTQTGANTFSFTDNTTVIEEPGFIPEPTTTTLGLLGLASLMVRRRRG